MALIGISGRIGSGKDEIGRIIQYLTTKQDISYTEFKNRYGSTYFDTNFEIKKFADALKYIVCILTGCTREQLEDIDFKNSYLPKEWNHITYAVSNGKTIYDENEPSIVINNNYTYRTTMTTIGDILRFYFQQDVFVNALFSKYKGSGAYLCNGTKSIAESIKEGFKECDFPNWIITDVRFENEAKTIKDRGGIVIRVNRPNMFDAAIKSLNLHPSETALDDYQFDYIIDNNSTIEDLIHKVKEILIKEQII